MRKTKVGYAPIVEPIFDHAWAEKVRNETLRLLNSFDDLEVIIPKEVITLEKDAMEVGAEFRDSNVDLILLQAINSDSGILVTAIGQKLSRPIILWSTPEPSLHGSAVLANSTCGAMIIASTLRRLGLKYQHVHGFPEDPVFQKELKRAIDAAAVVRRLRESKLGLVGYVPPGFHHSAVDELLLRKTFGIKMHHVDLSEIFFEMKKFKADEVKHEVAAMKKVGEASPAVKEKDFEKTAAVGLAMRKIADTYGINAQAVKCFPEFQDQMNMVPCAAMGRCNDLGLVTSCEADLGGSLTMLIQNYLTHEPVFFVDIISLDNDEAIVWHCGNGVSTLSDPDEKVRYDVSSLHGVAVTTEMAMKPGPVTLARFSQMEDHFHLYVFEGQAVKADPTLRGVSMKIHCTYPTKKIGDIVFEYGVENHFSVAYGHIAGHLEQVAKWLGIETTIIKEGDKS